VNLVKTYKKSRTDIMKKTLKTKIFLTLSAFLISAAIATAAISYFFSSKVVKSGDAYGFEIGETRLQVYAKAKEMIKSGDIEAIHTWPEEEYHRPFLQDESKNTDPRWKMIVNSNWWNNGITVSFENNIVVEIRRDRIFSELP